MKNANEWYPNHANIERIPKEKKGFGDGYAFPNSDAYLDVIMLGDKPYFPALDCAKMLGYSDPQEAIRSHCKEDGCVTLAASDRLCRGQEKSFINEGNLYRLIVHSKIPSAERFEKWMFEEVLPKIRKTGGFVQENLEEDFLYKHYTYLDEATKLSILEQIEKHRQEYDEGNSSEVEDTC